jgi:hypothetical protein
VTGLLGDPTHVFTGVQHRADKRAPGVLDGPVRDACPGTPTKKQQIIEKPTAPATSSLRATLRFC